MKIKYNIPMLNEIKNRIKNVRKKVENNKKNKVKVPMKYYTLLILMLAIGMVTFTSNAKRYSDINTENYTKYTQNDNVEADSTNVQKPQYETAISSISTNVSNMDEFENNKEIDTEKEEKSTTITTTEKYIYPIDGDVIKDYAMDTLTYSKTLEMWKVHPGLDIAAPIESAVVAVQDGKVIAVEQDNFYGNTIKLEHSDGYVSVYSNLDEIQGIIKGKTVKQGEIIGKIGVSAYGEIADESHLHFELLKDNEWINPVEILE